MLTENEARDLLTKAANTIDVEPGAPIDVANRRKLWPILAAAAAVVAVIGTTAAIVDGPSDDPRPAPDPTTPNSVLARDQIPSVFAYDAASARSMLVSKGLVVTEQLESSCGTRGRALRTAPPVGSRFDAGESIVLFSSGGSATMRCAFPADRWETPAWRFLDFANGRGSAPAFAEEVKVYWGDQELEALSGTEAADPSNWGEGSPLDLIRRESAAIDAVRTGAKTYYSTPVFSSGIGVPDDQVCGGFPPSERPEAALTFSIHFATDGLDGCPDFAIYRVDNSIAAIVVHTGMRADPAELGPVPDVVGLTQDEALARLQSLGFGVETRTVSQHPCQRSRAVMEQFPQAGSEPPATGTVWLYVNVTSDLLCGTLGSR